MNALVLPNRRLEAWKYTDLRNAIDPAAVEGASTAAWKLDFVSGAVDAGELPAIMPRGRHGAMGEAAASLAKSGTFLRIGKGEESAAQLRLAKGGHGRLLIVVEEGASLTLRETTLTEGFINIAVDIVLGTNARLSHIREAPADEEAVRVVDCSIRVAADATYRGHIADFGGKLSRSELHIALEGEGAEACLSGVSLLSNKRHADISTHIAHEVGNTHSTQLFKLIGADHSRGIYQGKITVAHGANGSDSRQTAKGLLFGERAEIDLKPELEILADDVKCAHGAAIGDLDPESLFYLRSRGVPEFEARAMLMRAFLGDAIEEIADDEVRASIWDTVDDALRGLS
jgi:Fe-S cluster assembly protein SufD